MAGFSMSKKNIARAVALSCAVYGNHGDAAGLPDARPVDDASRPSPSPAVQMTVPA